MCNKYLKRNPLSSYQTILDRLEFQRAFSIQKLMYEIFNIVFTFALKVGVEGRCLTDYVFQVIIQKSMNLNELGINRSGNSNLHDIFK